MLNITYGGRSGSVRVGDTITSMDARRIAVEVIRSGGLPEVAWIDTLPTNTFDEFVLDSFREGGHTTYYLRPKVPFGQG